MIVKRLFIHQDAEQSSLLLGMPLPSDDKHRIPMESKLDDDDTSKFADYSHRIQRSLYPSIEDLYNTNHKSRFRIRIRIAT